MKTSVLVLLFANLAFFGYAYFVGVPSRVAPVVDSAPPIPRIQLASEAQDLPSRKCLSIGPFGEQSIAERTVLWLRGEGRTPQLRTTEVDAGTGWWVKVESATLQQATRVALRLRAAGVADVEVLPPGEGGTTAVVSLGIYSDRGRADRRIAELRQYALAPTIVEQPRTAPNWWIDVPRSPGDSMFDLGALQKAVPEATGIVMEVCPAVLPPGPATGPAPGTGAGSEAGSSAGPDTPVAPASGAGDSSATTPRTGGEPAGPTVLG